ncbi:DNA-binding protein [Phlyctochytrium arcticum]|nr:DNA-binding protein [Phlyctochytrium arcticum]
MTLQIQRPPETTQNLSTIPTVQNSLNLVRNLMGTTLGAITYLRGLFPEKNYKDTKMGGLTLKKIARNYSDEADELMNWLEQGCFDALEKQYVSINIVTDTATSRYRLEAYTFGFSYPAKDKWCISIDANGKNAFKVKTKGEIMKATTELLRRLLILTQTLSALPPQAYITMKLFYYDETTPEDYEPPYFRAGDDDEKFYFAHRPEKIRVGQIETPHHA